MEAKTLPETTESVKTKHTHKHKFARIDWTIYASLCFSIIAIVSLSLETLFVSTLNQLPTNCENLSVSLFFLCPLPATILAFIAKIRTRQLAQQDGRSLSTLCLAMGMALSIMELAIIATMMAS